MPYHQLNQCFPYPQDLIFDLVADVGAYPTFLPWCHQSTILESSPTHLVADLHVGFGPLKDTFRSKVFLERPKKIIIHYEDGPLRHLHTTWQFFEIEYPPRQEDSNTGPKYETTVCFTIDFTFKKDLFNTMMRPFFNQAFTTILHAFESEARRRWSSRSYEKGSPSNGK